MSFWRFLNNINCGQFEFKSRLLILNQIEISESTWNFWIKLKFLNQIDLFLTKIEISNQNWNFRPKFLDKTEISDRNWDFWPKLRFLAETEISGQNWDFLPKLRFVTEIEISGRNWDFWPKLKFPTKIEISDQNWNFPLRIQLLFPKNCNVTFNTVYLFGKWKWFKSVVNLSRLTGSLEVRPGTTQALQRSKKSKLPFFATNSKFQLFTFFTHRGDVALDIMSTDL